VNVVVAIDGPSGVGKSTTSRLVAKALDLPYIDTGAMYRAVALEALRQSAALDDASRLAEIAAGVEIELRRDGDDLRIILDGTDVSAAIRMPEISMAASTISAVPAVRKVLVRLQQELGRKAGGVIEGRDTGTKIFPETPFKFFLTARPEVRARRRFLELSKGENPPDFDQVLSDLERRDRQDSTRAESPLTFDDSYVVIDTSEMTIEQVVGAIVEKVLSQHASSP
jgi:CMP/dCMP kinase